MDVHPAQLEQFQGVAVSRPLERLRHHVTGAIERGEKEAITEIPAQVDRAAFNYGRALPRPALRKQNIASTLSTREHGAKLA